MYEIYDAPLNYIHELYYYTYQIRDAREQERLAKEKEEQKKQEGRDKIEEMNKRHPTMFDKRLSPAAQARESRHIKSQNDELEKAKDNIGTNTEGPSMDSIDMEDLVDAIEEGG